MTHRLFISAGATLVTDPGLAEPGGPGEEFLEAAQRNWLRGPHRRGVDYARGGKLTDIDRDETSISATVGGSSQDYFTTVMGVTPGGLHSPDATCTCMYGSRPGDWCKHAIALAFAAAAMLDSQLIDVTGKSSVTKNRAPSRVALLAAAQRLRTVARSEKFDPEEQFELLARVLAPPAVTAANGLSAKESQADFA